jgi:acyl-coenzyme A thioesterase 13
MEDAFADITARMGRTPIYELLGIGLAAAGDGAVTLVMDCDDRHSNLDGVVHGGLLALLADTAMGFAVRTQVDAAWPNKTLSLSVDYVQGARHGERLTVAAEVDHATRRFRWARAELTAGGRVAARARSLNLVEAPDQPPR